MIAAAMACMALLLASCGSNNSNSKSTTSTLAAGRTQASTPTGSAIKLGSICSCAGSHQLALQAKIIQDWAQSVNGSGGINGHPVSMTVLDDGQNPATALQDAKELVDQDHIIALVGEFSLQDAAFASYMAHNGIPVVGGISSAPFLTSPDFFPSGSQLLMQTLGTFAAARGAGKKHIGVLYCAESPICAQLIPLAESAAKLNGLALTVEKVSSTAPSYTAQCLSLKSAGADSLFVAANANVVQRVTDACAQQGYRPQTVSQTSTISNFLFPDPNLNGALLTGYNANPYDASIPAIREFQAAVSKYSPALTSSPQYDYDVIGPWAGGQLFAAAAKAAHITPASTPADVKRGLYALKDETLGGLTGPLNFTQGKPAFVPCYFSEELKGGKLVSLNGNKPTCLSPTQTAALLKALHL